MNEQPKWLEQTPGVWAANLGGVVLGVEASSAPKGWGQVVSGYSAIVTVEGPWGPIRKDVKKQSLRAAQAWCIEQVPVWHNYVRSEAGKQAAPTEVEA